MKMNDYDHYDYQNQIMIIMMMIMMIMIIIISLIVLLLNFRYASEDTGLMCQLRLCTSAVLALT